MLKFHFSLKTRFIWLKELGCWYIKLLIWIEIQSEVYNSITILQDKDQVKEERSNENKLLVFFWLEILGGSDKNLSYSYWINFFHLKLQLFKNNRFIYELNLFIKYFGLLHKIDLHNDSFKFIDNFIFQWFQFTNISLIYHQRWRVQVLLQREIRKVLILSH